MLGLPMTTQAQKRATTKKTTTTSKSQANAAAQAEQEKKRQEDLERQQKEQQQSAAAQELQQSSASANASARPIPPSDVMWKKTVWRAIDLREKQNKPMFSVGKEITQLIVDAVKRGELQPYLSDSVTTPISAQAFVTNLNPPSGFIGPAESIPGGGGFDAAPRKTKKITKKDDWTGQMITVEV